MMRWDTSPAPFEVPPDSTSMSLVCSAWRIAASSFSSSSGMAPRNARLAAILVDRRGDDRAIGVVDRGGPQRLARLHQFVAGGDHGDARPARDGNLRNAAGRAACRSRASRSWCRRAAAPRRARCRSRHRTRIARARRRGGFRSREARRLRVLDHDDGIGAARQRAAGRDRGRRSRQHGPLRRGAAGDDFVVQHEADRRGFTGGSEIGGTHRKAIDIGTIERRHVDRRHDVFRQRAAERIGELAPLAWDRARKQRGLEIAPARPRATGWSGTGPDRGCRGFSARRCWSCGNPYHSRNI